MNTAHHPPGTDEVEEQRRELKVEWRAVAKYWAEHQKDPLAPVPITKKTNKPYTKVPEAPKMPKVILVYKARKMKETHGEGGCKCDLCSDCSCDRC